jgi:hypothetical protein
MSEQRIYKYPLEVTDRQEVHLPEGAMILHVGVQNGVVCLWALVDPDAWNEHRTFWIVGTGNPMPPTFGEIGWIHHGTVQQGLFVWHVWEER